MKNRIPLRRNILPAIALLCATSLPKLPAQDAPTAPPAPESQETGVDDAIASLGKAAETYVDSFNKRDAAAIAALYAPLGEIVASDGETLVGRQAIEDHYADLFAAEKVPRIALEASEVIFSAPDMAIEEGLVHLTYSDDESVRSIGYVVTHVMQDDGSWLMAASHSLPEDTTPSEQIKPLHWLIGEWTLEAGDGVRIDMVLDLDERENYLIGEALITDAMEEAQTIDLRIGRNPATASVYWWTFDSEGGNASGPWAQRGDEWIVNTTGITADAEVSASSQTLTRDGDTMVWSSTQRMLAGEALPDLTYRFVRRAPDPISLLESEASAEPAGTEPATDGE